MASRMRVNVLVLHDWSLVSNLANYCHCKMSCLTDVTEFLIGHRWIYSIGMFRPSNQNTHGKLDMVGWWQHCRPPASDTSQPLHQALLNKLHKSRSFIIMHHHRISLDSIMYTDSLHVFGLVFHVKHAWCPGLCLLLWLWGWLLWRSNQCGSLGWRLDVTHAQMKHIDRFGIVKPWPIAGAHSLSLITIYTPTSQAELDSSLVWCQDKTSHPENRVPFLLVENANSIKKLLLHTYCYSSLRVRPKLAHLGRCGVMATPSAKFCIH